MGNSGSASDVVPSDFNVGAGFPEVAVRSGMSYAGSKYLLTSLGMSSGFAAPVALALTALDVGPDVIDLLRQTGRRIGGIPQHYLVLGIPEEGKYPAIYQEKIGRSSPYTFKYTNERYTITGIACLPVSKEIQSPEVEVSEGGLNHSHVAIRLKPEKEYKYACQIIITGRVRQPHRRQSSTDREEETPSKTKPNDKTPRKTETNDQTPSSAVHKVTVSLQPFWSDRPAIWFAQAEAQFQLAGITCQLTKYNYVVSQLNQQQAAKVADIISSPPEHVPYDRLKEQLVRHFSVSHEQGSTQRSHEEMGDREPSPDNTRQFLEVVQELSRQVASLGASQTHSRSQSTDRHHSHSSDRRRNIPNKSPTPHDVCWYHLNFGDRAHKCRPPCSRQRRFFRQQENSTGRL